MFADDTVVCCESRKTGRANSLHFEVKVNKRLRGEKEEVGADNWRWRKYRN